MGARWLWWGFGGATAGLLIVVSCRETTDPPVDSGAGGSLEASLDGNVDAPILDAGEEEGGEADAGNPDARDADAD